MQILDITLTGNKSTPSFLNVQTSLTDDDNIVMTKIQAKSNEVQYNIKTHKQSTARISLCFCSGIQVFVSTPDGKRVPLDVKIFDTIDNVKAKIEAKEGIPSHKHQLVFGGRVMEDGSRTLADYDIQEESILVLQPIEFQIFVRTTNDRILTLDVKITDTISNLKEKVWKKVGTLLAHQTLQYAGKPLTTGELTLDDYGIHRHSNLFLF